MTLERSLSLSLRREVTTCGLMTPKAGQNIRLSQGTIFLRFGGRDGIRTHDLLIANSGENRRNLLTGGAAPGMRGGLSLPMRRLSGTWEPELRCKRRSHKWKNHEGESTDGQFQGRTALL